MHKVWTKVLQDKLYEKILYAIGDHFERPITLFEKSRQLQLQVSIRRIHRKTNEISQPNQTISVRGTMETSHVTELSSSATTAQIESVMGDNPFDRGFKHASKLIDFTDETAVEGVGFDEQTVNQEQNMGKFGVQPDATSSFTNSDNFIELPSLSFDQTEDTISSCKSSFI